MKVGRINRSCALATALLALAAPLAWPAGEPPPLFDMEAFQVEAAVAEGGAETGQWRLGGADTGPVPQASVALALAELPAVSLQRRGHGAVEPVLRGLALDRVATRLNGISLPAGSPTQTAAPVNFLPLSAGQQVGVVAGFPSVTSGPAATGGLIELTSGVPEEDRLQAWLDSNPAGGGFAATAAARRRDLRAGVRLQAADGGDYESGGAAATVDADYRAWSAAAAAAVRREDGRELQATALFTRQQLVRNASLPLDTKDTDALVLAGSARLPAGAGRLALRAGYAEITPFLTNEDRPPLAPTPVRLVEMRGSARSATLGADCALPLASGVVVQAGADFNWQERNAVRQRFLNSGAVFDDHLWPDIRVSQPGAYVEAGATAAGRFSWRAGARLERTAMRAGGGDLPVRGIPGAQGATVRANFIQFNGPDAGELESSDWTGAANAVARIDLSTTWSLHAGAGALRAAPGPTERYRALVNALGGGLEIGNPALAPETKRAASLRLQHAGPRLDLSVEGWLARVDDFIQREVVLAQPLVYGFRNRDAEFRGLDLAARLHPARGALAGFTLDAVLAVVEGSNRAAGYDLPEMPPWQALLSAGWRQPAGRGHWRAVIESRVTGAARNERPDLNPLYADTPSYAVWDFSFGWDSGGGWTLLVAAGNLFDKLAYPYLYPPVAEGALAPSSGTLLPGDRIPLPGRSLRIAVEREF